MKNVAAKFRNFHSELCAQCVEKTRNSLPCHADFFTHFFSYQLTSTPFDSFQLIIANIEANLKTNFVVKDLNLLSLVFPSNQFIVEFFSKTLI